MEEINKDNVLQNEVVDDSNALEHHGILGMKWGVRRDKLLAKKAKKNRDELDDKSEKFKTSKKKSVDKLSNDELKKEVERRELENRLKQAKNNEIDAENKRIELENKYAELNPKSVSLGKRILDAIWPRVEKAGLDAGETLIRDGLINIGKKSLGLEKEGIDDLWKKEDYERNKKVSDAYKKREHLLSKVAKADSEAEKVKAQKELNEHNAEVNRLEKEYTTLKRKNK